MKHHDIAFEIIEIHKTQYPDPSQAPTPPPPGLFSHGMGSDSKGAGSRHCADRDVDGSWGPFTNLGSPFLWLVNGDQPTMVYHNPPKKLGSIL